MGNRFASMPGYHGLIRAHGIIAVIAFLFLLPAAILIAQFYHRSGFWALRMHIYLQILVVGLSTVVFVTGFNAVGIKRSLTNPHHGIGVAIYTLILIQALGGAWIRHREKKRMPYKLPIKLVLHQWLGRTIALLAFAQVPLGLTLYGSPKWTFITYALWMFFLLVLFFVLCYRALPPLGGHVRDVSGSSHHGGTVISDKKPSRFGGLLGPLVLGAGAATLLGRRRNRSRSRSRSHSRSRREEVIPSRRGSGSYIEEEKYNETSKKSRVMDKLLKGAAVFGAAGLAKSWYDKRQRRRNDDDYSSVDHDTPSRRHGHRHNESELSEDSVHVNRMEEGRRPNLLPGPGDPVLAAAAMSAAAPRPTTPRPVRRQSSFDSGSYSYDSTVSPSRRPQSTHGARNGVLAGLGLGWFAKKMKDRRDRKELDRLDRIEAQRIEDERLARHGATPSRLTGDGFPSGRRHGRRGSRTQSTDISSVVDDPHYMRPGAIPPVPVPAPFMPGPIAQDMEARRSRYDVTQPVAMPPAPPDPHGVLHQEESGSEAYMSAGGHPHRRPSERRRREGEIAAAAAVAEAASHAAREEERRRRSRSRAGHTDLGSENVVSPPVSVKLQVHGDKDRNVTLRRLTEQEAAAEREARKSDRRRRRADSLSSLSGTDTGASRRRYRREDRVENIPPPAMAPLTPPAPPFAGGRKPKDSAYYSGRPNDPSGSHLPGTTGSVGSPESHGTWSAMSPSVEGGQGGDQGEAAAERRRRRRLERNQRNQPGTVDFS